MKRHLSRISLCACGVALALLLAAEQQPALAEPPTSAQGHDFRTFFVTRSLAHERLLPFLREARPEIVQVGNYGAMFHGYANHEKSTGWPMNLPVAGERAALKFQRTLNEAVHDLGLTAVGHFRLIKAMGNWKEQTGFVEYYNKQWPEDLLGPRPHADLRELLQRTADGEPIQLGRYNQSQLGFCVSSPYARQMFKAMLKVAVDNGVDGVMTNFNYRFACACPHCQTAFKGWLQQHYSPQQLQAKLGIQNLDKHTFETLPANIPGYPDPAEATELDWAAKRWGAEHFKQMFDEIFIDYGRTLNKDLIVGQWNHLGHVSISEERAFTPIESWSQGEDYFWYSGGASFVGKNLNLSEHKAGDAWLSCLYTRELSGRKPFVMGKYDGIRLEASMAEGYATGGLGMGRYMRFEDPVGYDVLVQYLNFMHQHRNLYEQATPYSDIALVLPRQSVLNRHGESLSTFRSLGQALVEDQVLIDVLADQRITSERLAEYPAVILPDAVSLSDSQLAALSTYAQHGGKVLVVGDVGTIDEHGDPRAEVKLAGASEIGTAAIPADILAGRVVAHLKRQGCVQVDSPWTVRASAYQQPGKFLLHLVNYNRAENGPKTLRGPAAEVPIPEENISVNLQRRRSQTVTRISLHAPEVKEPESIPFEVVGNQVKFTVPTIRVYGVLEVSLQDPEK